MGLALSARRGRFDARERLRHAQIQEVAIISADCEKALFLARIPRPTGPSQTAANHAL
jgi:hypothetical protein